MPAILQIILRPRKAINGIAGRPRWGASFALLAAASCALLLAGHTEYVRFTLDHLPPSASAQEIERVRESLDEGLPLRVLFLPVRLSVGWASFALLLMFATRSLAGHGVAGFRHFFALEVHAEAILLFPAMLRTVAGGAEGNPLLIPLLATPNIFTFWYIVLLAYGAAILCRMKFRKALLPVVAVWLLSLAFDTGVTILLRDALHLRV